MIVETMIICLYDKISVGLLVRKKHVCFVMNGTNQKRLVLWNSNYTKYFVLSLLMGRNAGNWMHARL